MTKYNRPNGKLFGSSATNIGVFGSGQTGETPTTSTDPNAINTLNTHWEDGWNGAVVSQAPYTAPYIEDMNAVNYVNSYNSAYLLQRGIPEYDSNEEYQTDSVCTYNGEIWICLQDGTTNTTPTEGAYWHLQAELPIMQDNEILVGDTGNGATVTDTLNQGDILATTSGLDVKAGVITNTHISSQAGDKIAESKINLAYSTSTLNTNIGNVSSSLTSHTSNTANPHVTKISNLNDTNVSTPSGDDTLVYDGINSEWINLPNTVDNLKGVTITSISQGDTLSYDGTKWVNQEDSLDNLTNTTITSATSGDVLTYNGTKWVNKEDSLDNLTNVTITSENTGDAVVYDGSKWINQENSVDNLTNTTITSATSGDTLSYNGSAWINQANSVTNLTDTTISVPTSGDALTYDGSKWINQANSLANLTDTTIATPSSGEVVMYDGTKWVNGLPSGGAVSTLSDVTLTTPLADGEILAYDSGSSKWINSNIIEINDIANINTATTDVTLTATDKRHQIFTAPDGFNVTLPSTDIKAGESFVFDWSNSFGVVITTPFIFYSSNNTVMHYAWRNDFTYKYTALVDTPTSPSDWLFSYALKQRYYKADTNSNTYTSVSSVVYYSPSIFTLKAGIYEVKFSTFCNSTKCAKYGFQMGDKDGNNTNHPVKLLNAFNDTSYTEGNEQMNIYIYPSSGTLPFTYQEVEYMKPWSKSGISMLKYKVNYMGYVVDMGFSSSDSGKYGVFMSANLIAPITTNDVTA